LTVQVVISGGAQAQAERDPVTEPLAAGFENWRTQVWGSARVRDLGAQYFPRLARSDLHVPAAEMTAFLRECALLRTHLDAIAASVDLTGQTGVAAGAVGPHTGPVSASREIFRDQVSLRLSNIESRARLALTAGADLVIE
jgi:hypothetical protein